MYWFRRWLCYLRIQWRKAHGRMNTFLICPVRGVSSDSTSQIVQELEKRGLRVHWPHRDTKQDDPTGLQICQDNLTAILKADIVHVIWDGKSQGVLFDLGMAFALRKKIISIELPAKTPYKSFQNMVLAWEKT